MSLLVQWCRSLGLQKPGGMAEVCLIFLQRLILHPVILANDKLHAVQFTQTLNNRLTSCKSPLTVSVCGCVATEIKLRGHV